MYQRIREFFAQRKVLEVDTPLLGSATANEPHLASYQVAGQSLFLQTSPEFAMKRLLASGSGPIYQICKAFRHGESGVRHNPEFTLLEWYQPGFELTRLMDEVVAVTAMFLGDMAVEQLSYRQAFLQFLDIDPHRADIHQLRALAIRCANYDGAADDTDTLLELLMSHAIEPHLGRGGLTFIYDYPASQAALARVEADAEGVRVARRFELYRDGMELANGYQELTDPVEQQRRFTDNRARRSAAGLVDYPGDGRLLAALEELPECCGVALGLDRLLMLQVGAASIDEVLAFPIARA